MADPDHVREDRRYRHDQAPGPSHVRTAWARSWPAEQALWLERI